MIVAPARSAVAELTCPCATVIEAESAACCVLDAPDAWSAASFACAVASVALAAATSPDSVAESIAASRWPLPTFCPAVTQTAVTWPDAGKLRSSVSVAATVPDAGTLCRRVPVVTVADRYVTAAAAESDGRRKTAQPATPSTTITATAIARSVLRLRPRTTNDTSTPVRTDRGAAAMAAPVGTVAADAVQMLCRR